MQNPQYEILETDTGYAGFFHILRYRLRHRLFNGDASCLSEGMRRPYSPMTQ